MASVVVLVKELSQGGEQKALKGRKADKPAIGKLIQDDLKLSTWIVSLFWLQCELPVPYLQSSKLKKSETEGRASAFSLFAPHPL